MNQPVMETVRLTLRPLTAEDFTDYAAMLADPEVGRFLFAGGPMPAEDAWRELALFIGHREMRGYSNWALVEKATGQFVGRAGPWQPFGWPGLEIGWCLRKEYWGKGYATEAARAALTYCFEELEADQVISLIRTGNTPSVRVAERIGHTHLRDLNLANGVCHLYGQSRPTQR